MPPAGGGGRGCPASVTARGSGTSEPDRRWRKDTEERTPTAIYEWRGRVQLRTPALGGPAPRAPPPEGDRAGGASPPRQLRRAPLRLFPARRPHPALGASCRGAGILWRRRREAPGVGPGLPARAASSWPQGARLPLRPDRNSVRPSSHSDLQKDPHSAPSVLAGCQKSPRLDRSNMVH